MSYENSFGARGTLVSGGYGAYEVYPGAGLGAERYGRQPHPYGEDYVSAAEVLSHEVAVADQPPFSAEGLGAAVSAAAHRRLGETR